MKNTLPSYTECKEANLPWLGRIPAHWELERAKWLFTKMERPVRESDDVITCFRDGTVTLRKNRRVTGFTESLQEIGYQGVRKGDLVIHIMDAAAGAIGVSDSNGKSTPVYIVLTPNDGILSHYYAPLLQEMARQKWIDALAKGIRQRSVDFRYDTFSSQILCIPPFSEQRAITRYLEWADERIQRLIKAREKQIELLEEYKQAIIQQAVTGQIDVRTGEPYPDYKDSGVEWLGKVPAKWNVLCIKYLASLKSGENITSQNINDKDTYAVYGGNGIRGFCSSYTHSGEFVLIGRQGALCGNINYAKGNFWASEHAVVATPKQKYELIWFGEMLRIMDLNQYSLAAAQPGLSVYQIENLKIPVPPISEQFNISEYIERKTAAINKTIKTTRNKIDLLMEYRTRLIADVVTGKVDVRQAAANLPDREDQFENQLLVRVEHDLEGDNYANQ